MPCRHIPSNSCRPYSTPSRWPSWAPATRPGASGVSSSRVSRCRLPEDIPGQPQARGDPGLQGLPQHQFRPREARRRHPADPAGVGAGLGQGVRGEQGQGGRGLRLRLWRTGRRGQGARAGDRAGRPGRGTRIIGIGTAWASSIPGRGQSPIRRC